jgi:hypothetical protein
MPPTVVLREPSPASLGLELFWTSRWRRRGEVFHDVGIWPARILDEVQTCMNAHRAADQAKPCFRGWECLAARAMTTQPGDRYARRSMRGRRHPRWRERLPRRALPSPSELGGAGVPQPRSLQRAGQGRAFRGLGTAAAVPRRGSRDVPVASLGGPCSPMCTCPRGHVVLHQKALVKATGRGGAPGSGAHRA